MLRTDCVAKTAFALPVFLAYHVLERDGSIVVHLVPLLVLIPLLSSILLWHSLVLSAPPDHSQGGLSKTACFAQHTGSPGWFTLT